MNRGFISLFMVLFFSLTASMFVSLSASGVWSQSSKLWQYVAAHQEKRDAISCINIVRLRIALNESDIRGEYPTEHGACEVVSVQRQSSVVKVLVKSLGETRTSVFLGSIEASTHDLISIVETDR